MLVTRSINEFLIHPSYHNIVEVINKEAMRYAIVARLSSGRSSYGRFIGFYIHDIVLGKVVHRRTHGLFSLEIDAMIHFGTVKITNDQ